MCTESGRHGAVKDTETGDPGPDPDRVTLTAAQRDSGGNIEIIRRDRFISLALVTIYLTVQ